jgi:hypothetical protein
MAGLGKYDMAAAQRRVELMCNFIDGDMISYIAT